MRKSLPTEVGTVYLERFPIELDAETVKVVSLLHWERPDEPQAPSGLWGPIPSDVHNVVRLVVRDENGKESEWHTWDKSLAIREGHTLSAAMPRDSSDVWMIYDHDLDKSAVHSDAIVKKTFLLGFLIPAAITWLIFFFGWYFLSEGSGTRTAVDFILVAISILSLGVLIAIPALTIHRKKREIDEFQAEYLPKIESYLKAHPI